jgi:hypothetical protein
VLLGEAIKFALLKFVARVITVIVLNFVFTLKTGVTGGVVYSLAAFLTDRN